MIATKTNLEITEYREKFFLGLSLRQLACFAAAAVLAIATCFVCLHWLRMDMQVVSYIVMVEVLPFLGLGFIHRDGYPFEKLVKIYWAWSGCDCTRVSSLFLHELWRLRERLP